MKKNSWYSLCFFTRALSFFISLLIVALGQPAREELLGIVSSLFGYALFFLSFPKDSSPAHRFWSGALWFFAVQLIQLSWMTAIEFQGYYILLVYFLLSAGMALPFGGVTLLATMPSFFSFLSIAALASSWTLFEWIRLFPLCGLSWNPVGLSLTCHPLSLQWGSVFGILGLSFWVILTNLFCFHWVLTGRWKKEGIYFILSAIIPYCYGMISLALDTKKEGEKILIALVQTNLLPSEKSPHPDYPQDVIDPTLQWKQIVKSLKAQYCDHWDLIVLPESAVPYSSDALGYSFEEVKNFFIEEYGEAVAGKFPTISPPHVGRFGFGAYRVSNLFWCQTIANLYQAEVVIGMSHIERQTGKSFNSAFYFMPSSIQESEFERICEIASVKKSDQVQLLNEIGSSLQVPPFSRYDKQILLPLGESLPFEALRPFTKKYGISHFFSKGEKIKIFGEKKRCYAPSICYEETFSELMRKGRIKGAHIFVNLTNDNYYPNTLLHRQHLYHSRLRAVENGIFLLRSCNSGVSAVVDCCGKIIASLPCKPEIKSSPQVLSCSFNVKEKKTLFSFWGDGGIVSICLILIIIFFSLENRKKKVRPIANVILKGLLLK